MAFLEVKGKNIYYEVHGAGEAFLILNGIMMSTVSWERFIPDFSDGRQLILMDFYDQGRSDKLLEGYDQDIQVEVVLALLNHLGIEQVNLFGISYGGEVAMRFALKHQECLLKLLLFNTTAYTNPWLKDIGKGWVQAAKHNDGEMFYNVTIPIIYSPMFYTSQLEWMNARKAFLFQLFQGEYLEGMIRLINSAENHDVRNDLGQINADTLVVSSDYDFITPAIEQEYLHAHIPNSAYLQIKNSGHASMYERPKEFVTIVKGFLNQ